MCVLVATCGRFVLETPLQYDFNKETESWECDLLLPRLDPISDLSDLDADLPEHNQCGI